MAMEGKNKAESLIRRFNKGKARPQEANLVKSWYLSYKSGDTLGPQELQYEHDLGLEKLNKHINARGKIIRLGIASAAAAVLLIAAVWILFLQPQGNIGNRISASHDISAGGNHAFLTLANGNRIQLSGSKSALTVGADQFSYEDGTLLHDSSLNEISASVYLKAQTPRGGTYKIVLSDGTSVTLNAESSLSFPKVFSGAFRTVELRGEGYFEVAKNKSIPFIVKSNGLSVAVLGTQFNLNSYPSGSPVSATLVEGSVKVSAQGSSVTLVPGQQATLDQGLHVAIADIEAVTSWKEGYFRFNDEPIQEIMTKISRWYNVDVIYKGNVSGDRFTGAISRFSNISEVLNMLERTKIVHFEIEGRRVTVLN